MFVDQHEIELRAYSFIYDASAGHKSDTNNYLVNYNICSRKSTTTNGWNGIVNNDRKEYNGTRSTITL